MEMNALRNDSAIGTSDRLALTLFLALAIHAIVILGISFQQDDDNTRKDSLPTLDITVVNKRTDPPEEADYLAQVSQDGAGNVPEKVRPQQPQTAQAASAVHEKPAPESTRVITREESRTKVETETDPPPDSPRELSASELINRSMEMVSLNEEINQSMLAYSKRPKQVYISTRTREYKYANYMNDWVNKVERVGNLNYPDEARRQEISGNLLLDVSINPDGSVRNITVLRPSGHKIIDEAAIRIVNLAAPFAPFPNEIRKEADVLHITRTWEFSSNILHSK